MKDDALDIWQSSALLVTDADVVLISEVASYPASNCQSVTVPLTVSIRLVPVVVKRKLTRLLAPVPFNVATAAPERITPPVP